MRMAFSEFATKYKHVGIPWTFGRHARGPFRIENSHLKKKFDGKRGIVRKTENG